MKFFVLLPAVLLVAGCAANYGSQLDNVGKLPNPPVAMSADEGRDLTSQAEALRSQADAIRAQLALEKDRVKRIRQYGELRLIEDRLVPLERRLADAGRPSRGAARAPTPG